MNRRSGPPGSPAPLVLTLVTLATLATPPPCLAQVSRNMTLLANMNLHPDEPGQLTGYMGCAPYIHSDGREYVALMTPQGASIVRLTDPAHPVEVGFFGSNQPYSEARQYGHYLYMTTNNNVDFTESPSNTGLAILDMSNPDQPHKVANLKSPIANAHSLEIDPARGLLFVNGENLCDPSFLNCTASMKIFSLADPENPQLLATYPTYVHHIHIKGTLGYASLLFEGGDTSTSGYCAILDLSDPSNPREITRIVTPRIDQHSTWTSDDGRTLYVCNEVARDGLTVWDVSNPASPQQLFTFEDLPRHMIHQPRVRGNQLFLSYYTAGVRVMDLRDPGWPVEFAYYDTHPTAIYEGLFFGAYDVQPFYPSGIVVATDTETGLYVFRVDPVNYGIVRGVVREAPNGPVVPGATVTIDPAGLTVKSGRDGRFAFAAPPGAATVTASMYSFEATSKSVSVGLDTDQTITIAMRDLPAGTLSGTVTSAGGSVAGAEVDLLGTPQHAVANASGVYTFASVPEGSYTVRAARPGLAAKAGAATVLRGRNTTLDFSLGATAYYEDAEANRGWILGDPSDVNAGVTWERAVPVPKFLCSADGAQIQTGEDHTPAPGTACFVTSNFTVTCFAAAGAVAGTMTLTSPPLHLAGISDPRIGYWRWFQTTLPPVPTTAALVVKLSADGGATWVTAETYRTNESAWRFAEIRVRDFIPNPGDVLLRFVGSNPQFDTFRPEIAIDDIAVYPGDGGGALLAAAPARTAPRFVLGVPRPTPSRGAADIDLTLGRATRVRADLYDIQGRLVRTILDGELSAGRQVIHWDGRSSGGVQAASGVYWMTVRAGEESRKLKLIVMR